MKKSSVFFLLIILLFIFASCRRIPTLQDEYDSLFNDYVDLQAKYEDVSSDNDRLSSAIQNTESYVATLYSYFNRDSDVSFNDAADAFDSLDDILSEHY